MKYIIRGLIGDRIIGVVKKSDDGKKVVIIETGKTEPSSDDYFNRVVGKEYWYIGEIVKYTDPDNYLDEKKFLWANSGSYIWAEKLKK